MSITDTPTAPSPSKFDVALEKAKRVILLRGEAEKLEGGVRNTIHILTHAASRATTEADKAELRRQHQRLRGALIGHL